MHNALQLLYYPIIGRVQTCGRSFRCTTQLPRRYASGTGEASQGMSASQATFELIRRKR